MSQLAAYHIDANHGRTVVRLLPFLNEIPWPEIEKVGSEILRAIDPMRRPAVLVDLCPLNYMSSASVALVVRIFKAVKERDGQMVVANADPLVLELLRTAGLDKIWQIVASPDEGLQRLGVPASESIKQSGGWQNCVAALGLIAGVVGLVASLLQASWMPGSAALGLQVGGAGVAFGLALWAVLSSAGVTRAVGAMLLVGSVALLLAGVFVLGRSGAPAQPARATTQIVPVAASDAMLSQRWRQSQRFSTEGIWA